MYLIKTPYEKKKPLRPAEFFLPYIQLLASSGTISTEHGAFLASLTGSFREIGE